MTVCVGAAVQMITLNYIFAHQDHNCLSIANHDGKLPMDVVVESGSTGKVKLLLSCGAEATSKDKDNNTLLHKAAANGHASTVHVLLASLPEELLRACNSEGKTAFDVAKNCAVKVELNPGYLSVLDAVHNKEGADAVEGGAEEADISLATDALLSALYTPGADINAQVWWLVQAYGLYLGGSDCTVINKHLNWNGAWLFVWMDGCGGGVMD